LSESEIIKRFFTISETSQKSGVVLGIGDDAAIVDVPAEMQLVLTMDTLIENVHFFPDVDPYDLGYKSVAVNLSDLAAMGAEPCWLTLSLTTPTINNDWLQSYSRGFFDLAKQFNVSLIGGDIIKGPLSITLQAHGLVPKGQFVKRNAASPGDLIYVTGQLGAAGLALKIINEGMQGNADFKYEFERLHRPQPRVEEGLVLRDHVTSMIDISDGLMTDLGHILELSKVGAEIILEELPSSENLSKLTSETAWEIALTSGDDYELCFTLPDKVNQSILKKIDTLCPLTHIGHITDDNKLKLIKPGGKEWIFNASGYQHF